jgi:hypothetical protein
MKATLSSSFSAPWRAAHAQRAAPKAKPSFELPSNRNKKEEASNITRTRTSTPRSSRPIGR